MEPKTYIHKPTEIEAIQLTPESFDECIKFIGDENTTDDGTSKDACFIVLKSDEGERSIRNTDYIIQGVLGIFYPCTQAVFAESYDVKE